MDEMLNGQLGRFLVRALIDLTEKVCQALDGVDGRVFDAALSNLAHGRKRHAGLTGNTPLRHVLCPQASHHKIV